MFVSTLRRLMAAFGRTAPVESRTAPLSSAKLTATCAKPGAASAATQVRIASRRKTTVLFVSPVLVFFMSPVSPASAGRHFEFRHFQPRLVRLEDRKIEPRLARTVAGPGQGKAD